MCYSNLVPEHDPKKIYLLVISKVITRYYIRRPDCQKTATAVSCPDCVNMGYFLAIGTYTV